jgi:hypothetical protein
MPSPPRWRGWGRRCVWVTPLRASVDSHWQLRAAVSTSPGRLSLTPGANGYSQSTGPTCRVSMTYERWTRMPYQQLTFSLPDSPASRSVVLANGKGKRTRAGSGRILPGSFAVFDLHGCCWRTFRSYVVGAWEPLSGSWPRAGMTVNGIAFRLPPSARPIIAIVSGLLPTPTVHGNYNRAGLSKHSGNGLATVLRLLLPTPRASPNENRQYKPTPSQLAGKHGRSQAATIGGPVNPLWLEWYMGYPAQWTDVEDSATPSSLR